MKIHKRHILSTGVVSTIILYHKTTKVVQENSRCGAEKCRKPEFNKKALIKAKSYIIIIFIGIAPIQVLEVP